MVAKYTFSILALFLLLSACKESKPTQEAPIVEKEEVKNIPADLIQQYSSGEVQMCHYQDQLVYKCSRNAPDAGSEFFNTKGKKIGGCYYATNQVAQVCREAKQCRVIYRVFPNIWGLPKVIYAEY
ncbi:MAG TPA: hypothetical protein ENJ82_16435 [Bacteroidetes bacterium]|nr:hypothetical protein [Bacteroidota bacterium]